LLENKAARREELQEFRSSGVAEWITGKNICVRFEAQTAEKIDDQFDPDASTEELQEEKSCS
jgi:hypothetical protein